MPLDHSEVFYWQVSDRELNPERDEDGQEKGERQRIQRVEGGAISLLLTPALEHLLTYVAPTCRSLRKAGVNW